MRRERWWVHRFLFHLRGNLRMLPDGTIPSPPSHTPLTEAYSVGKLAAAIWGRCTNDTTYFRKDNPYRTEQKFKLVLDLMCKENGNAYTIPRAVARIAGSPLFWPTPEEQFQTEIVDCEYPFCQFAHR